MTKDDVWNLFKQTGKVEYFIKYQQMVEGKIDTLGSKDDRRDNN